MFLRFVRLKVREEFEARFAEWYRERVVPALQSTPGCLFAGLLSPWRGEDHKSLTIWESAEAAHAYEEKGLYHRLLREAEPMLSKRTEWKFRLASDPLETADLTPRREIPSEGYVIGPGEGEPNELGPDADSSFVRIVSIRVDPTRLSDFVATYTREVLPAFRGLDGCRGALLAEATGGRDLCLSISFWRREQDAARYESSGEFARLTERLKDMFSPVYSWRLTLGGDRDPRLGAPKVSSYQMVLGKKLGEREPA